MRRPTIWTALAGAALLGTIAVTGCTGTTESDPTEASDDGASFLACLTAAGVEAKINDSGQVLVKIALEPGAEGGVSVGSDQGTGALGLEGDEAGDTWVVAADSSYFQDDPATQDAYASCERDHPGFTQPDRDPAAGDPDVEAEQQAQEEAALAFAQCARANGYSQIEDPDYSQANALQIPDDLTEDEFRDLVEQCWDRDAPVFNVGQSIDAPFEAWAVVEDFLGTPAS